MGAGPLHCSSCEEVLEPVEGSAYGLRCPGCDEPDNRVRQILYDSRTLEWLPGDSASWCAGGCLVLARSLELLLGDEVVLLCDVVGEADQDIPSDVVTLVDRYTYAFGGAEYKLEHFLVRHLGLYLDGDGLTSEMDLLRRWHEVERIPYPAIAPFGPSDVDPRGIPDAGPSVAAAFARHLADMGMVGVVQAGAVEILGLDSAGL